MAARIDIRGNIAETGATQINNVNVGTGYSVDDINRSCLRAMRCPDSHAVKNRLKENKDKLLYKCFDWIFNEPYYICWQESKDVCLLWIKGGAGKGKTMMSIGLIEALSQRSQGPTVVTYFFCQNADYELNTMEAIIKGLILQLVRQQEMLKECLRDRWDAVQERFTEDVSSWRGLWKIFMEMLDRCRCPRVYVIVDALDECRDDGIADLLESIVRNGLSRPFQIKWLLTSRPLDSAERKLLADSDQVRVDLELNSKHISQGVNTYISYKVAELDRNCYFGLALRQDIEQVLRGKAEDTFLWVSLVCKKLENVDRDQAMTTIQDLPPGLVPFYDRILNQICNGEPSIVNGSIRLLKVMMAVFRPLNMREVSSVTGLPNDPQYIQRLIDRSASFVKTRGMVIEFVHQSTRDYLSGTNGKSPLDDHNQFGHGEMAMSCLNHLSRQLKSNMLNLPRPDSTRDSNNKDENELLASLDYAVTFWFQHLDLAKDRTIVREAVAEHGSVEIFLYARFLQWLECLSLLDKLPRAVEALKMLADMSAASANSQRQNRLLLFAQDAMRFLLRHYHTVSTWPLQVYSSAVAFSPISSVVRRENLDKIPHWLTNIPIVEEEWTSLIQTLAGHSGWVNAVAFSPDGGRIVSGSHDNTVKIWDTATGEVQKTLAGHSHRVNAVAFSPDGRRIVSGSRDNTVKIWDTATGEVQKTLAGHSGWVLAVAFSRDGRRIVSGSRDNTVKIWDTATGEVQKTLAGHSGWVRAVTFSPDGRRIVSGSRDNTVKIWDTATGEVQKTLAGHSGWVSAVAFSRDGRRIVSGSHDNKVKIWDTATGEVQKTLAGHSGWVNAVAFSPDGRRIVSGSGDNTVKIWDTATGEVQKTLAGHSGWVNAVAFSPDGRRIVSGSGDNKVKIWDTATGEVQKTLAGHSGWVSAVAFSPDGRRIVSGSGDNTVKIWDTATGEVQKTLAGHSDRVNAVAFSPDGRRIVSGSGDNKVKIWDTATGEVQKTLAGHSGWVNAVAFSPDGRRIVSGSDDNTVKIWDTATGEVQKTLAGHSGWVLAVAFSPDGRRIVSGSDDNKVKIWDTATGEVQKTLAGHSGWVSAVAFSPDGRRIVSGSRDNTVKVWDIASVSKISRLLGPIKSRRLGFRAFQEIKCSKTVTKLRFSADSKYLITDIGLLKVETIATEQYTHQEVSSHFLYVLEQWIYFNTKPVLRLPADFQAICWDVRGDQLAIGLASGQVINFTIDCQTMDVEFS